MFLAGASTTPPLRPRFSPRAAIAPDALVVVPSFVRLVPISRFAMRVQSLRRSAATSMYRNARMNVTAPVIVPLTAALEDRLPSTPRHERWSSVRAKKCTVTEHLHNYEPRYYQF
jgi:hypothetical protein